MHAAGVEVALGVTQIDQVPQGRRFVCAQGRQHACGPEACRILPLCQSSMHPMVPNRLCSIALSYLPLWNCDVAVQVVWSQGRAITASVLRIFRA